MAIELVTKYLPFVDELFTTESKTGLVTNKNFTFDGAHTVKIWKAGTADMNDYGRHGASEGNWSRYGALNDLTADTETYTIRKDRSFTFVIDRLDEDESILTPATALARQLREVVIPEVDAYTYNQMAANAGNKPTAVALTKDNIYEKIVDANNLLDIAEAPDSGRVLLVTPSVYLIMKKCKDIVMETDVGNDMRLRGVIANLDGLSVIRVPASRMPENFGFMVAHNIATVGVQKLASYKTHSDPVGISGSLVEGRIVYDAFVLENKADAICYQAVPTT